VPPKVCDDATEGVRACHQRCAVMPRKVCDWNGVAKPAQDVLERCMEMQKASTIEAPKNESAPENAASKSTLTKLDWKLAYNRSSLHLSNQLRGKRFSADQLILFDDSLIELPVEIQERARAAGINLIGFDFSVSQQKAFEAALSLINASGRQRKIRIRPGDWIEACQLRTYEHRKGGYQFYSQKEREEAFKALLVLGIKPFLMNYHKVEGGRQIRQTRIAPLWRLTLTHAADAAAPKRIEDLTPDYISKADWFEIEFEDIWFDQIDNFSLYKPRNLFERIRLSLSTPFEKIPSTLHPFLEWVFAEAGRIRNEQKRTRQPGNNYMLRADWHEVALQSRLHTQLQKRNFKRAQEMLTRNAELAQKSAILNSFRFEGSEFIAAFNPRQFEELEDYLKGRRRGSSSSSRNNRLPDIEPPPWNAKKMTPFQVKGVVDDWKRERDRVKENARYKAGTAGEQEQVRKLNHWIKSFEAVLYGREV